MQAIIFCLLIAVAAAGKVQFTDCGDGSVKEVRVNQCQEGQPCKIKRGSQVTIEVDFVPNQNSAKAQGEMYSSGLKVGEENMCKEYLPCPIHAYTKYTLRYHGTVPKNFPRMKSEVTGKLNGDSGMISCAKVKGELV